MDIGDPVNGFAGGTEETVYGIKYKKASATFNDTTAFGGAITGSGPLTVSGYATFAGGRVQTGSRGTYASPVPAASDSTVHALYRNFALTAGGTPTDQPHRLRISIAGWSEETRVAYGTDWKWFWQGYIDDAQSPSGLVTVPATEFIRDRSPARNSIEGTNSIAAGYGASNYAKDPVEVTTTATGLYGTWDTTAPDFAGLKASSDDWATEPAEYELIPVSSAAGLVSRLEMHFFDNEVQYTAADNWRWLSRTGWYQTDQPRLSTRARILRRLVARTRLPQTQPVAAYGTRPSPGVVRLQDQEQCGGDNRQELPGFDRSQRRLL